MPKKPERIYWDSCVYISCIEKTPGRYPVLRDILDDAESGKVLFVASAFIIAEVNKFDDPTASAAEQAEKLRKFFENDYIEIRAMDRRTAELAADISRTHRIKPPDAVHVATAILSQCSCLQTYDGDKGEARKLLAFNAKIGSPPLTIEVPQVRSNPDQSILPGMDEK
ncbi:MAG: PIN domain-containing protein [Planctomycetes bacterium]|nr:PIN domain-containing protein [Planctomycetota bacterium]